MCRRPRSLTHLIAIVAMFALGGSAQPAGAQVILSTEHVDVDIGYTPGPPAAWSLGLHDETNDRSFGPNAMNQVNGATLRLINSTIVTQPSGSTYAFTGATPGSNVWVLRAGGGPGLQLGFGAEDITPGTFATYTETDPRVNAPGPWIRTRLVSVNGPGSFALWRQTDINNPFTGTPTVFMSTADNGGVPDATDLNFTPVGGHVDYYWSFSQPGDYSITLQSSAFLGPGMTNATSSNMTTFFFNVVQPVPEPSSLALVGVFAAGLAAYFRRRRRNDPPAT
jgi:hypothetical protein